MMKVSYFHVKCERLADYKMHSYISHNGMLSEVARRLKTEKAELERHLSALPGGREAAISAATKRRAELEASESTDGTSTPSLSAAISLENLAPKGPMTPGSAKGLTGYDAPAGAASVLTSPNASGSALRNRRKKNKHLATDALRTSLEPSAIKTPHEPRTPHILAWSEDEQVALLARNIDAMEDELKSNGTVGLTWPENVTYWHFADFMCMPTLVYQLEYPRTAK
jgi:sterol O-acyltransferase